MNKNVAYLSSSSYNFFNLTSFFIVYCKLQSTQHRVISKVEVRKGREADIIHRLFTGTLILG